MQTSEWKADILIAELVIEPDRLRRLVTTRFKLSEANLAFECLLKGKDEKGNLIMKLMVGDY